jgi:uncharacterized Fe-S cluster-containing radical SAM superfamily protein
MSIDTDRLSASYRLRLVDVPRRQLLLSRIAGSEQESDLSESPNVNGLGRVRHFNRNSSENWVSNPLPIDPACAYLGLDPADGLTSQVFQNAACNWRCWYCYVPFDLLAASPKTSQWANPIDLVDQYLALTDRPPILDLSGGQPELTPEWVLWTIDALEARGQERTVYLWSDDNLSNDYFWRFLNPAQRSRIASYRGYGRVACFKGFDAESFEFNTAASASGFQSQLSLFGRYIAEGLDMYAYVTLTHPHLSPIRDQMERFVDALQAIDPILPLRTIPLKIDVFTPVVDRLNDARKRSIEVGQHEALREWSSIIADRFTVAQRMARIQDLPWTR